MKEIKEIVDIIKNSPRHIVFLILFLLIPISLFNKYIPIPYFVIYYFVVVLVFMKQHSNYLTGKNKDDEDEKLKLKLVEYLTKKRRKSYKNIVKVKHFKEDKLTKKKVRRIMNKYPTTFRESDVIDSGTTRKGIALSFNMRRKVDKLANKDGEKT